MAQGKVKKLVQDKGFGFIQGADGQDVFFHHTTVSDRGFDDLQVGQAVEYSLEAGSQPSGKGPRAASVAPA